MFAAPSDDTNNKLSMSTVAFESDPVCFREILIEAGFSPVVPDETFLALSEFEFRRRDLLVGESCNKMHYDAKQWARTRDDSYRLPLFVAVASSLEWADVNQIFNMNMPAVYEVDLVTGLPLFMLAAVGRPTSDLESIYNLLREYPSAIKQNRYTLQL